MFYLPIHVISNFSVFRFKIIYVNVILGMRRRSKAIIPHDSTALLNQLRVEEIQKEREFRKQQLMERKATLDAHIQGMTEWEDKLMDGQREQVKAMWEVGITYLKTKCNRLLLQWNLSNPTHQGTMEICLIVQAVRTCLIQHTKGQWKYV